MSRVISDASRVLPFAAPPEVAEIVAGCPEFRFASSADDLLRWATPVDPNGWSEVAYELPGGKRIVEARVCRARNGLVANYLEPYMRRRDPDCMVIGDELPTDKPRFRERYGRPFEATRHETLAWLGQQPLALFAFHAGLEGKGAEALAVVPLNAAFFAYALGLLQGVTPLEALSKRFEPRAVIYLAPPFRHSHFGGKQVVVHSRGAARHELFSYNLYPGPSAKKGIFGILLNLGEIESWVTMHSSTVQVATPYDQRVVIAHEGASGGGKSEMLQHAHRQADGSLKLGRNTVTGEERSLTLPAGCELRPVTDDMALCHPSLEKGLGKLTLMDAEDAWFVRCNHIAKYGTDPLFERLAIAPSEPLLFLNIEGQPGATALPWEPVEDAPGQPCPNPRVVIPRRLVPDAVEGPVDVDVRSFGIRAPACSAERPSYGIVGLFHLLPPALAWLWRLVAPRGHSSPSIIQTEGMSAEGVGAYWPFATGRRSEHANMLLNQIIETPEVQYLLIPNQHIGAWEVGFMPQWIAREYIARRGKARFREASMRPSRCPLLGYTPGTLTVEGRSLGNWLFEVDRQPEVGPEAYDCGAQQLTRFFKQELSSFLGKDLLPTGQRIVELCLADSDLEAYRRVLDLPLFEEDY